MIFFCVRERSSSGSGWCPQGAVLLWWSLPSQVLFPAPVCFANHQRWSQSCKLWKIITGLEPRYRCRVPECELANSSIYTQEGREGLLPSWWFTISVETNNMRSIITICTCSPHYYKYNSKMKKKFGNSKTRSNCNNMKKNTWKGTVWILWKELSAVRSLFSPMASALTGKVGGKSLRNKI